LRPDKAQRAAIRETIAGKNSGLSLVFRQFAQILEDQARRFRRLVAFFLFFALRISERSC
jgi:hypothetical protein